MKKTFSIFQIFLYLSVMLSTALSWAKELKVHSYYGIYDATKKIPGLPSKSLVGPITENWTVPTSKIEYHIGVLFPHLQDPYWETANYGIVSYARKLKLKITLYSAGAYINFGNQRAQLMSFLTHTKVDGIVLAAVDYSKMDPFVEKVSKAGIPVVGLINDINAPAIKAKSAVSFFDMGYKVGEYVLKNSRTNDCKIAFFPGPENTGWAPDSVQGFRAAISELKRPTQNVTLLKPLYGDTRQDVQRMRLDVLNKKENHDLDFIVGNAVAAVEAVNYLRKHKDIQPKAKIVSTYITFKVYEQIKKGTILAAPSEQVLSQCQIGLDMIVKILNGEVAGKDFPFRASPLIPMITYKNIDQYGYEELFGEKGFKPFITNFNK